MKISAVFLLSGFFFVDAVPICAQHYHGMVITPQQQYEYNSIGVNTDEQNAIENLEKRCQELEDALKNAQDEIQRLRAMTGRVDDESIGSPLYQMKTSLIEVESKLTAMEGRLTIAEDEIQELASLPRIQPHPASAKPAASKPKTPNSKPKAPVNSPKPAANTPNDR